MLVGGERSAVGFEGVSFWGGCSVGFSFLLEY